MSALQELKVLLESINKKKVDSYSEKYGMKMANSSLQTTVSWVDGALLSDEEKQAVLSRVLKDNLVDMKQEPKELPPKYTPKWSHALLKRLGRLEKG